MYICEDIKTLKGHGTNQTQRNMNLPNVDKIIVLIEKSTDRSTKPRGKGVHTTNKSWRVVNACNTLSSHSMKQ